MSVNFLWTLFMALMKRHTNKIVLCLYQVHTAKEIFFSFLFFEDFFYQIVAKKIITNNQTMLRIALFYFFAFALFLFSVNCGNKSSFNSGNNIIQPSKKHLQKEESNWMIKELNHTSNNKYWISTESKHHELFVLTPNGIGYYDGHSIKDIVDFNDSYLTDMDFNGNYIAYSVHPTWNNYQLKHILFISKTKKVGNDLKIVNSHKFVIPFSQSITGVKFLSRNQILITSFLEYGIVDIITKPDGDFNITFNHYLFRPYNIDERMRIAATYNDGNILVFGGMSVNLLQRLPNNKYDLNGLFNLNTNSEFNRADEEKIIGLALVDTTFGIFQTNKNLVYYLKNHKSKKPTFIIKTYIRLENGDSIGTNDIVDFKFLSDSDFVCLVNNGLLLEQKINKKYFRDESWKVIARLPVTNPTNIGVINKDSILVVDPGRLFLITKNFSKEKKIYSGVNNNPVFTTERLAQLASSYGVGIEDLDNNGMNDIYIVDVYDKNKLFISLPKRTNTVPDNLAVQRGIEGKASSSKRHNLTNDFDLGVAIGDINEDGAEDIILTNLSFSNSLYLNNGKGYFQDVTKEYNFNVNMWRSEGAVLGDVNNDGYLDVYCTSFFKTNKLFINDHGISLDDKTNSCGLKSGGRSISAVFGDVNNDGYPDLYVGNWMKENKLFFNNGKGEFIDHTKESNVGDGDLKETNSIFFADLNNDGYLDLFVGNRAGGDKLYLSNGDGTFKDITNECGLNGDFHTYGAVFGDFDNDGWQDIVIACLGKIKFFKNLGADSTGMIHYKDITDSVIPPGNIKESYNTGLATADLGNKGFLDLVMNQNGGYTYFVLNATRLNGSNNYLSVKVEGDESNRDAVGAKLKLYHGNSLIGYREISGGYGYASSSSKIQHFGLGSLKDSLTLVINFPASHITKRISVIPNTFITVTENSGAKRNYFLVKKDLLRFFYGNGFIVLGIELILLAAIFFTIISLAAGKLKLNKALSTRVYSNWKILSLSILVFYAVKIVSVESMSFYFGPSYFIINSTNLFTDEILPLLISSIFTISFLLLIRNKESKSIAVYNVPENLLTVLKRFGHGEGMLIVLHRLSLLIENLNPENEVQSNYEKEAMERIGSAFAEYKSAVLPEINRMYSLLNQLDSNGEENLKYSNYGVSILQCSSQISNSCELLLNGLSAKEKVKAKEEAVISIKKIRQELTGLRKIVQSNFSIDTAEAINLAIKKFREQNPDITIQFYKAKEKLNAIISTSDFNESMNIIIQNAIDELHDKKVENGIIKIEAGCENNDVIIKVKDNGKGIPIENLEKIFSEGFTTKADGHGIGLSIVKKCLDKYEGEITAANSEMGGALFIMKLKSI
ncbi:MAG: FG-GAP-like repeat-containing protein [Bacteroidetes bacterium]|nr:FG-GAP-like repeat-containing protein [Bacteroidota bacterium]